ncbi:hypothetical protein [Aneurinibacillus uraniidurans]|uniref:hypothetical protein n=1 Tax=Aneurinibacillus uraniidurans TaxID=2966586 RepID=UPI002349152E|nr:hypothetical protein [Aneurinibacillus sp. B1]WCN39508.1 hypothetical protein PO771_08975 [Aneurinibacillus sp. B1]
MSFNIIGLKPIAVIYKNGILIEKDLSGFIHTGSILSGSLHEYFHEIFCENEEYEGLAV